MLIYFVAGVLLAGGLTYSLFYYLQMQVLKESLSIDDGKGYLLISTIVVAFLISAGSFWVGQYLGFDQDEHSASLMALCVLFNIMATLMVLIYGLVKFHEPEHY